MGSGICPVSAHQQEPYLFTKASVCGVECFVKSFGPFLSQTLFKKKKNAFSPFSLHHRPLSTLLDCRSRTCDGDHDLMRVSPGTCASLMAGTSPKGSPPVPSVGS